MSSRVTHQLFVYSTTGDLLTVLTDSNLVKLQYGLKDNTPSVLEFIVHKTFGDEFFDIDFMVEVYRNYAGSVTLEGETAFFIRKIDKTLTTINITAYSACEILGRRIVAYYAGTSYAEKVRMPWDDLAREFVYENFGPGASYAPSYLGGDPTRNLEPWFVVENDKSLGAQVSKTAPWRTILDMLQEVIGDIRSAGLLGSFDVIRIAPGRFEFRVFVGPRGIDHSASSGSPVVVSKQRKNLIDPSWSEDWTEERNFVYGTGQGQNEDRIVVTDSDPTRMNISPFNRREFNQDARQSSTPAGVGAEAQAALNEHRPFRTFTGQISQTAGCIYGIHWKWGDIVTVEFEGITADCYVDTVTVTIDSEDGTEVPVGYLRSVTNV